MADKKNAEELFKDYTPEIMTYDPDIEGGNVSRPHGSHQSEEERLHDDQIRQKIKEQAEKAMTKEVIQEKLKEYTPEIMYYDPKIDGGEEHLIRDELLNEKERLKDVITRLKQKNRGDRKVRR